MPDITFSLVTQNCEDKILPVIDSIRSGMTPLTESGHASLDYTIIFVDIASTDGTKSRILQAKNDQPHLVEWIGCKANSTSSTAHNRTISLLKGLYHVVMTPDMQLPMGSLLEMARFMDANPDVGLLLPKVVNLTQPFTGLSALIARRIMRNQVDALSYATGGFYFFRTEVFLQVHGFDESFPMTLAEADMIRQVNAVSQSVCFPGVQVLRNKNGKPFGEKASHQVRLASWLRFAWKWRARK